MPISFAQRQARRLRRFHENPQRLVGTRWYTSLGLFQVLSVSRRIARLVALYDTGRVALTMPDVLVSTLIDPWSRFTYVGKEQDFAWLSVGRWITDSDATHITYVVSFNSSGVNVGQRIHYDGVINLIPWSDMLGWRLARPAEIAAHNARVAEANRPPPIEELKIPPQLEHPMQRTVWEHLESEEES